MNSSIECPPAGKLAIVIPAFKAKFLRAALQSIAVQTSQNFQLYVFDDCSPDPVGEVTGEFSGRLAVKYHRFDANLGRVSLVRQWERCLQLVPEPWIWLFSDDDFMDPGCVAAFFDELRKTNGSHDAYRFNTVWHNDASGAMSESPSHPVEESGADFVKARLQSRRQSTLQELIFSRRAWVEAGGIPEFSLGWHADDAFIALLGSRRLVRTISGPRVNWRLSDVNITNDRSPATARIKISAALMYTRWVGDYFARDKKTGVAEVRVLAEKFLVGKFMESWIYLDREICRDLDLLGVEVLGHRRGWGWLKACQLNLRLTWKKVLFRLKIPC